MPVLNSTLGMFSCITPMCIEGNLVMSCKCYDVTFKLRAVAIAEGKSKDIAAREFKWMYSVHV